MKYPDLRAIAASLDQPLSAPRPATTATPEKVKQPAKKRRDTITPAAQRRNDEVRRVLELLGTATLTELCQRTGKSAATVHAALQTIGIGTEGKPSAQGYKPRTLWRLKASA